MEDPGLADHVLRRFGEESRLPVTMAAAIAPASPPTIASMRRANALRPRSIAIIAAKNRAWRRGRRRELDPAERIADGAEPREPGVFREVISAGEARARRRQKPRLEAHIGAGLERRRSAHGKPDAIGCFLGREPGGGIYPQNETSAGRTKVHLLDEPFDRRNPDAVEDRRGDSRGPPSRRKLAGKQGARAHKRP